MIAGDVGSGRDPLPPTAITLFKGGNRPNGRMLPPPTIDAKRQIKGLPAPELFIPNVHRIKNVASVRLPLAPGSAGSINFPRDVDPEHLAEMLAEQLINGVWFRDPHTANETWDLYVMAYTAILRFGGTDPTLGWVPAWARPPVDAPRKADADALAVVPDDASEQAPSNIQRPARRPSNNRNTPRRRGVRVIRAG